MNAINKIILAVASLTGSQFASFTYTNKNGETARHTLRLGFSYAKAVEKSILELELTIPTLAPGSVELLAATELLESLRKTANGTQPERASDFESIGNGLAINRETGSVQLAGLSHAKVVLTPGVYPVVKSAAKTIAKDKLRSKLPVGLYRTFTLSVEQVESAKINGEAIAA